MKRRDFEKHLTKFNCFLLREGRSHSIFMNNQNKLKSPVPRHREVNNITVMKICRDLKISRPSKY